MLCLSSLAETGPVLLVGHQDIPIVARATDDHSVRRISVVKEWLLCGCCSLLLVSSSTTVVTHDRRLLRHVAEVVWLVAAHLQASS